MNPFTNVPFVLEDFVTVGGREIPGTVEAEFISKAPLDQLVISMYAIKEDGDTLKTFGDYKDPIPFPFEIMVYYAFACGSYNYHTTNYTILEYGYDYSYASTYTGTFPETYVHSGGPDNDYYVYSAIDATSLGNGDIFEEYYYVYYIIVQNKRTGETRKMISVVDTNF